MGCRSKENIPEFGRILDEEIPELMSKSHVPGLSIAVIKGGNIVWTGAYGFRSSETREPVDEDTMFEAASLSKPVTAYTVLRLVDRGVMALDTPLADYYPYEKLAGDDRYKKLTARIVLTHTTGLPNWGTRFLREPGERFGYSGEGFLYLGRTAEKLTGLTLDELARREVFDPLGMDHTSYVWNESYDHNGACGHDRHGQANTKRKNTESNGGASLLTTARDYAAFISAIMNGRGLSQATIRHMISPHVKAEDRGPKDIQEKISWGWGWGVMPAESGSAFWHWGNNGDLRGYAVAYPESGDGVVFFANSENLFVISESIVSEIIKEKQWAFDWLEIERLGDPLWTAKQEIEEAFLAEDSEAGMKKFNAVREAQPDLLNERHILDMAYFISQEGKKSAAVDLLRKNLEIYPGSLNSHYLLGIIFLDLGQNTHALEKMEDCLALSPRFERAVRGRDWIKAAVEAQKNPVEISEDSLLKYTGDFGPRHIRFKDGYLYYQRDDRDEIRMIPLKEDLFSLEGNSSFRIQFVSDESGKIAALVGQYMDGRTDRSSRNE